MMEVGIPFLNIAERIKTGRRRTTAIQAPALFPPQTPRASVKLNSKATPHAENKPQGDLGPVEVASSSANKRKKVGGTKPPSKRICHSSISEEVAVNSTHPGHITGPMVSSHVGSGSLTRPPSTSHLIQLGRRVSRRLSGRDAISTRLLPQPTGNPAQTSASKFSRTPVADDHISLMAKPDVAPIHSGILVDEASRAEPAVVETGADISGREVETVPLISSLQPQVTMRDLSSHIPMASPGVAKPKDGPGETVDTYSDLPAPPFKPSSPGPELVWHHREFPSRPPIMSPLAPRSLHPVVPPARFNRAEPFLAPSLVARTHVQPNHCAVENDDRTGQSSYQRLSSAVISSADPALGVGKSFECVATKSRQVKDSAVQCDVSPPRGAKKRSPSYTEPSFLQAQHRADPDEVSPRMTYPFTGHIDSSPVTFATQALNVPLSVRAKTFFHEKLPCPSTLKVNDPKAQSARDRNAATFTVENGGIAIPTVQQGTALKSPEVEPLSTKSSPKTLRPTVLPDFSSVNTADLSHPKEGAEPSDSDYSKPGVTLVSLSPSYHRPVGSAPSLIMPNTRGHHVSSTDSKHDTLPIVVSSQERLTSAPKTLIVEQQSLETGSQTTSMMRGPMLLPPFKPISPLPVHGPRGPSTPPSPSRQLVPCITFRPDTLSPPSSPIGLEHVSPEDADFIRRVIMYADERSNRKEINMGVSQARRIGYLLRSGRPADKTEALFLTTEEAATYVARDVYTACPIITSGQQSLSLHTPQQFLDELYDDDAKVYIQDPTIRPSARQGAVRSVTIRELKERFSRPTPGEHAWNCLELATHVEDGLRPTFLNNEDCRLLTKLKHPGNTDKASRYSYEPGWKEVEKWTLLGQAGALTEPHQDSHGYSTYITVNHGVFGFGWLSNPSVEERKSWNRQPNIFIGGQWRYVVLRPGQTIYFPGGTIHFVFRLPEAGNTLAFGGHVLRCSQIVRWIKTLIDEKRNSSITNEELTVSAPAYLGRVEKFVRQALARNETERWGGAEACEEFLRLKQEFGRTKKGR